LARFRRSFAGRLRRSSANLLSQNPRQHGISRRGGFALRDEFRPLFLDLRGVLARDRIRDAFQLKLGRVNGVKGDLLG
jgi:hypothetical protein